MPKHYHLLVERLSGVVRWYGSLYVGLTADRLRLYTTVSEYTAEHVRPDQDDDDWHLGRVRFFFEQLQSGKTLDPISVDNVCDHGHVYAIPLIVDGHHRFAASCVAAARTISASYGGRLDLRRYLTGHRATLPMD